MGIHCLTLCLTSSVIELKISFKMALTGKVCIVTGASKGIGRGIAVQLGQAGATVYITGRSVDKLQECAQEIEKRGGKAVPVATDHSKDADVKALFERVKSDNDGRLDILVNNAFAGVNMIAQNTGKDFWIEDPVNQWDCINGVGLRNHFICTTYAARMMVEHKDGLIVNLSSVGGLQYLFNVCYGVGKAAKDRMAADCAHELKKSNVTMISLWPGPVKTEHIEENVLTSSDNDAGKVFEDAETVEFAGQAIVNLATDSKRIEKTGKIHLVCDLAQEYGFTDDDGDVHDVRALSYVLKRQGYTWLPSIVPSFVRVPLTLMHLTSNKF